MLLFIFILWIKTLEKSLETRCTKGIDCIDTVRKLAQFVIFLIILSSKCVVFKKKKYLYLEDKS